jgi:N-acetylglutamate synthase/N-acetylornithine aminotransferase
MCRGKGRFTEADCRMHQHKINSAVLQTVRRLKTEVQRGIRKIKDSIAEKLQKDGEGGESVENCHVA